MVAAVTAVVALPAKFKRGVNCKPTDDDGTPLTGSSVDSANTFATCSYVDAGECTYFFADGSFSSGSSTCPAGLPQNAASSNTNTVNTNTGGGSTSSSSGSISPNIKCAPVDKDGTALTASSADSDNSFATCQYGNSEPCTYFFADGSFSSGSSSCPEGLPQTVGSGAGTTTSSTAPAQTTTAAPTPPPATTSSTPKPVTSTTPIPPPVTTSSTEAPPTTSTSTFLSTSQPSSTLDATPTPSAVAPPPPSTTSTDDGDNVTTVFVAPSPSPTDGVANTGGNTNSATRGRVAFNTVAVMPLAMFVWALL